jgi:hypothetical protein
MLSCGGGGGGRRRLADVPWFLPCGGGGLVLVLGVGSVLLSCGGFHREFSATREFSEGSEFRSFSFPSAYGICTTHKKTVKTKRGS